MDLIITVTFVTIIVILADDVISGYGDIIRYYDERVLIYDYNYS